MYEIRAIFSDTKEESSVRCQKIKFDRSGFLKLLGRVGFSKSEENGYIYFDAVDQISIKKDDDTNWRTLFLKYA